MDLDFPALLGAELLRPSSSFIAKFVFQPNVVHDFSLVPGNSVQLDRYNYWPEANSMTQNARRRSPTQTIGTAGAREITKQKVIVNLDEYTGPSSGDSGNPNEPGSLPILVADIIKSRRLLYDMGNPAAFHQSIGSETLFQDYKIWQDRVYINMGLQVAAAGQASRFQGGYYNPGGVPDGGTYAVGPARLTVNDMIDVVAMMRSRNVPPFTSPLGPVYHALSSPTVLKHLRKDSDFREVAKYPGAIPMSMLQPGMSSMAAPLMPAPGDWRGMPNTLVQSGGFYGQVGYMAGDMMPSGFVYEGVRYFDTTNMPTGNVTLTYTAVSAGSSAATGAASRVADLMVVAGQQLMGEGIYGQGPEVRINENSDYRRVFNVIWHQFSGYSLLNDTFGTVVRSYE
jgi:hypothetical protein